MSRKNTVGIFKGYEYMNCSVYGNPREKVWIECDNEVKCFKTASDAQCGYSIPNFHNGDVINFDYHLTKNGNRVIDYVHSGYRG